eukprot:scaffold175527_cov17-Tisochrysis_lutea.AAC.1
MVCGSGCLCGAQKAVAATESSKREVTVIMPGCTLIYKSVELCANKTTNLWAWNAIPFGAWWPTIEAPASVQQWHKPGEQDSEGIAKGRCDIG